MRGSKALQASTWPSSNICLNLSSSVSHVVVFCWMRFHSRAKQSNLHNQGRKIKYYDSIIGWFHSFVIFFGFINTCALLYVNISHYNAHIIHTCIYVYVYSSMCLFMYLCYIYSITLIYIPNVEYNIFCKGACLMCIVLWAAISGSLRREQCTECRGWRDPLPGRNGPRLLQNSISPCPLFYQQLQFKLLTTREYKFKKISLSSV